MKVHYLISTITTCIFIVAACSKEENSSVNTSKYPAISSTFGSSINPDQLIDYAGQTRPNYIQKDNSGSNPIQNAKAMLGRVLFYDKKLSTTNSISCGSCHKQEFAFGDTAVASTGVNGKTGRHSMRLVNARFSNEIKFFWDERASSLENQTTRPIQDHAEMGFSGQNGDPNLDALLSKIAGVDYYKELFNFVYGNTSVTESKLQECLSQFIRSIQSFDSKFDQGRALANGDNQPFNNFTQQENQGKNLFLAPPQFDANGSRTSGGAGCGGCHRAPEFDIDPKSLNNGVIGKIGGGTDVAVTRSPSLRDLTKANGQVNSPFMHIGASSDLITVINHYNEINTAGNTNLDPRLKPSGVGQKLNLNNTEKDAIIAFLKTLGGSNLYTDTKWSNPFLIK